MVDRRRLFSLKNRGLSRLTPAAPGHNFYRPNTILIIAVRHLASNDDLFQQRRGTMPLSKQLFENLLDLVEIKIGALQIVDREDQHELKHLET